MSKKVLMIATVPSMIGQFNMSNIHILLDMGYEVHVAGDYTDTSVWPTERVEKFRQQMKDIGVPCIQIDFSRSPLKFHRHAESYRELKKLIEENNYSFIHTHTPISSAIVRLVARHTQKKVIYTAHGFHFYTGAPLKNWIFFYPVEKWLSKYTDVLITINREDYERAKKKFKAKRIEYVPGVGIDIKKFNSEYRTAKELENKRKELGLKPGEKMVLSVGELSARKNHKVVIEALGKLKDPSIHYFIAGTGDKDVELQHLAKECVVNLHLLGFRTDISELIQASNLFVFPSLQEGLPVALMEAIACKVPVVCSEIRGNCDLITDERYMFKLPDSHQLSTLISKTLNQDNTETVEQNYKTLQSFDLLTVEEEVKKIYGGGTSRTD